MKANATILTTLIDSLNLSISAFEREIGVQPSRVTKAIARESKLSGDIIQSILDRYPHVNKIWLKTGSGDMFIPTPHAGYTGTEVPVVQSKEPGAIYQMNLQEAREAARAAAQLRSRLNTKSSFEDVINAVNSILDRLDKMEGKE